jgi:hypothetical protein
MNEVTASIRVDSIGQMPDSGNGRLDPSARDSRTTVERWNLFATPLRDKACERAPARVNCHNASRGFLPNPLAHAAAGGRPRRPHGQFPH